MKNVDPKSIKGIPPEVSKSFSDTLRDLTTTDKTTDEQVAYDAFRGPNHTKKLPKEPPLKYHDTSTRDPVKKYWIKRKARTE